MDQRFGEKHAVLDLKDGNPAYGVSRQVRLLTLFPSLKIDDDLGDLKSRLNRILLSHVETNTRGAGGAPGQMKRSILDVSPLRPLVAASCHMRDVGGGSTADSGSLGGEAVPRYALRYWTDLPARS